MVLLYWFRLQLTDNVLNFSAETWSLKMLRSGPIIAVLISWALIESYIPIAHGQIPLVCSEPLNFHLQRCCPEPFPGAGPCGSHLLIPRGNCVWVVTESNTSNVRRNWPHYFNQICKCNAQFGNFDCGECDYGYRGEDCSERYIKRRRLINDLYPEEIEEYVDTLYAAKRHPSRYASIKRETKPGIPPPLYRNVTVYNMFVWTHYYVSKETYGNTVYACRNNNLSYWFLIRSATRPNYCPSVAITVKIAGSILLS